MNGVRRVIGQAFFKKACHPGGLLLLQMQLYSKQLDFRLGVEKRAPGVYTLVQEDASDENNNAENSRAKSIFARDPCESTV
jgi:hypothetical protein